jgi:hypothetical protein
VSPKGDRNNKATAYPIWPADGIAPSWWVLSPVLCLSAAI